MSSGVVTLGKNCLDLSLNCCPLIFNNSSSRDSLKYVFSAHVGPLSIWAPVYMLWFLLFLQWTFTACFFGPHTEFLLPPLLRCHLTLQMKNKVWLTVKQIAVLPCVRACPLILLFSFLHASLLNPKLWSTKKRAANRSNPSWWQPTRSLRTNNQQIRKLVIHLHCKLNSISTGACPRRRMDWWERLQSSASSHIFLSRVS